MSGLFITFEGPEGCGKSTQVRRVIERLEELGHTVVSVREPGATALGEDIREVLQHDRVAEPIDPMTELLLFEACRAQMLARLVRPAVGRGEIVISDRFADSTTAYQGYGRGFDVERILEINDFVIGEMAPHLTLLIDVSLAVSRERLAARNARDETGPERMEREADAFHQRVGEGYRALAERFPERICRIDGDQPLDAVARDIWAVIAARLPGPAGAAGDLEEIG